MMVRTVILCTHGHGPKYRHSNDHSNCAIQIQIQIAHSCSRVKTVFVLQSSWHNSAVYTGIKKPESFSHSGFSLKVARQLPLNTKKKRIEKPTSAAWFFETPPKFHWFYANVNARSNLAGIIRVFGHVIRDFHRNHPTAARDVMRTTRVRSKVERSRSCAPLTKTQVWDSGFFAHALFVPKTPNVMGFSGSVNGTTKNPGFWILVFANVNGPTVMYYV